MSFDVRHSYELLPASRLLPRARAVLLASAGLASFACDSKRTPPGPAASDSAGGAETSTFKLEPPAAREPEPEPAQFSALAPADGSAKTSEPATSGAPSPTCVHGWLTPPRGSALRKAPLDMMRGAADERFIVEEMRYFVGPEDAEVMRPRGEVERWYVKAYVEGEPERRQRWLIRRARLGSGVDAVAAHDSRGYGPSTWTRLDATDQKLADPFQHPCDASRPALKCMGLPPQVLGCLEGT